MSCNVRNNTCNTEINFGAYFWFLGSRNAIYVHENSRLTVQFMVHLFNDVSYLNQEYWVGATLEIGSDEIWAGQVKVTAVERTEKNEVFNKNNISRCKLSIVLLSMINFNSCPLSNGAYLVLFAVRSEN